MKNTLVVLLIACMVVLGFLFSSCGRVVPRQTGANISPSTNSSTVSTPASNFTPQTTSTSTVVPSTTTLISTTAPTTSLKFKTGRNDYTKEVDGASREFIIYVPTGYNPVRTTPLLFMFHGSSQSGQVFYEDSGWKEKAEKENFIAVFPTALKYRLLQEPGLHTKWNWSGFGQYEALPGTELKDDVHFVQEMLKSITATWNIDSKRIYGSGFSNGTQFVATRLLVEMGNVFAAFGTAGNTFQTGGPPLEGDALVSAYAFLGTNEKLLEELLGLVDVPMEDAQIMVHSQLGPAINSVIQKLQLAGSYDSLHDQPWLTTTLTFNKSLVGTNNEYKFRVVRGMNHVYPNAQNNLAHLSATDVFWEFFVLHPKK